MSVQRKERGHQYDSIVTMRAAHTVKNMTFITSQCFCRSRSAFETSLYYIGAGGGGGVLGKYRNGRLSRFTAV